MAESKDEAMSPGSDSRSVALPPIKVERQVTLDTINSQMSSPTVSEKEYLIKKRKRSIAVAIQNEDYKRYDGSFLYNGLFIDFLVRWRSDPRSGERIKALLDPVGKVPRDGEDVVKMEKLYSKIRRIITYFYKSSGDPRFQEHRSFKEHAYEIARHKAAMFALDVEVDRYRLAMEFRKAGRPPKEPLEKRNGRLVKFWPKYHNSYKTIDVRLAATGKPHVPFGTGVGGMFYGDDEDSHDRGNEVQSLSPSSNTWKMRPARGKRPYPVEATTEDALRPASPLEDVDDALGEAITESHRNESTHQVKAFSTGFAQALHRPVSRPGAKRAMDKYVPKPKKKGPAGPAPIPRRVKQVLSDASLYLVNQSASSKSQKGLASASRYTGKGLSASLPALPSMRDVATSPTEQRPFSLPHDKNPGAKNFKETSDQPVNVYLRACDQHHVRPNLMPFCTNDSNRLQAKGQCLSDDSLLALTEMFSNGAGVDTLEEVVLEDNTSLTEKSLAAFTDKLAIGISQSRLLKINMRHCMRNATGPGIHKVISGLTSLLTDGTKKLRVLDLSGIPIGLNSHLDLCKAIRKHAMLRTVGLADIGLGRNPLVMKCLTELTGSATIHTLDIGWNSFNTAIFQHLGKEIVNSGVITTLGISNCAAAAKDKNNPIEYFLEELAHDSSVTDLDISLNRIDFRGALVLEACVEKNRVLYEIDISHNPLGVLGIRSLLRLLVRETSGLTHFSCENCSSGDLSQAADENFQIFSVTNPGGKYSINLTRPYHRALLCMFYKTCERFGIEHAQSIKAVSTSYPAFKHASQNSMGVWMIPKEGTIDVTFSIEANMEKSLSDVADDDFATFLDRHLSLMRVTPAYHKTIPLFAQWKSIEGLKVDQITMLNAMSKDFLLSYSQFEQLCRSRNLIGDIAERMLTTVIGGSTTRFLAMLHMPSVPEYLKLMRRAIHLLHFNIDNPTGHYDLDLSNCCDFAIAERLLLLDRWEVSAARRQNTAVTSQRGVRCQIRNEMYQGKQIFGVSCIAEFNMPEYGSLEFDYISAKRPPAESKPIEDDTWDEILVALQETDCKPTDQVEAVTMVSHYFYVSALQIRALTGICKDTSIRCEFLVRLFLRLVDPYNEKIYRSRFENSREFGRLIQRLGHTTFFPFIQTEQAYFEIDMGVHDERLAAHILVTICKGESPATRDNIAEYCYIHPDGTVDSWEDSPSKGMFQGGFPRTWDFIEKMPTSGTFSCKYKCAPEFRKFSERCRLMQRFGFWTPPAESDVMWWSSIAQCPLDVVELVEFLFTKYKHNAVNKAFRVFTSPNKELIHERIMNPSPRLSVTGGEDNSSGSSAQFNLDAFKKGLDIMHCTKFDCKDPEKKNERIIHVFRYLDPSGEGQVSEGEFNVLKQLFSEIQLSIKEFVAFCERTFGDDLMEAWNRIDADGSGEIEREEWYDACDSLGFFGPTEPIFNYLDMDDEGTISKDEFKLLEEYQTKKRRIRSPDIWNPIGLSDLRGYPEQRNQEQNL